MTNEPIFNWNEKTGEASCILTDGQNYFYGNAKCHDEDKDMQSEKTGLEIAYRRAKIKAFKHIKNNVMKPQLEAYNQLYYSMNRSTHFNPKSYENKMLQRKIRDSKLDLDTINEMIAKEKQNLKEYIEKKDKFYKQVRNNRNKGKNK